MGDAVADQYWCHMCSRMVNPVTEPEIKCPLCEGGFIEQMGTTREFSNNSIDSGSEPAFSLSAPMSGLGPSRVQITAQEHNNNSNSQEESDELGRELESLVRRRRRRSLSSFLHVLQDLHYGYEDSDNGREGNASNNNRVILVNPFNEGALFLRGPFDLNQHEIPTHNVLSSLGDYLTGPGLDMMLQHFIDNDPNRYGSPPAQKEAIKAMPTVTIEENTFQCSICLEEFEIGDEAKEMPCKHKFHSHCIFSWLELHSSCPVCRYQMQSDDSKIEASSIRNNSDNAARTDDLVGNAEEGLRNDRRYWIPVPWPYDGLFSLSGAQAAVSSTSALPAATIPGNALHTDET